MVKNEQKSLPKMASLHRMPFYLKNLYETQHFIFVHVPNGLRPNKVVGLRFYNTYNFYLNTKDLHKIKFNINRSCPSNIECFK